eukprot:scaffold37473_cov62-Phaeocystis_antarctica.AAC.3
MGRRRHICAGPGRRIKVGVAVGRLVRHVVCRHVVPHAPIHRGKAAEGVALDEDYVFTVHKGGCALGGDIVGSRPSACGENPTARRWRKQGACPTGARADDDVIEGLRGGDRERPEAVSLHHEGHRHEGVEHLHDLEDALTK